MASSWARCGTCEWSVDDGGTLTIRPRNGIEGALANWEERAMSECYGVGAPPWIDHRDDITTVRVEGIVHATTCRDMFILCASLESIDLSGLDTSRATSMEWMFGECEGIEALDLTFLDTSRVESMRYMFAGCQRLMRLDVSEFDTSRVERMDGMFECCTSLATLDVTGWDTSRVRHMTSMFALCMSLESLELSGWDTACVEGMGAMFRNCWMLRDLDLTGWDLRNARASGMFHGCRDVEVVADERCAAWLYGKAGVTASQAHVLPKAPGQARNSRGAGGRRPR